MEAGFSVRHRRFIAAELAIGTVLSSVLPAAMMFWTMGPFPMPMAEPDGLLGFMAKNALGMGTVMTLLMTLGVRARVRKGTAPALAWSRESHRWLRVIPRNAALRSVMFGLMALAGPGLVGIAAIAVFAGESVGRFPFALIMAAASALIAVFLIPVILIGALTDAARPARTGESA